MDTTVDIINSNGSSKIVGACTSSSACPDFVVGTSNINVNNDDDDENDIVMINTDTSPYNNNNENNDNYNIGGVGGEGVEKMGTAIAATNNVNADTTASNIDNLSLIHI